MTLEQFEALKNGDKVHKVGSKLERIISVGPREDLSKYARNPSGNGKTMGLYAPRVDERGNQLSGNLDTWEIAK